MTAPGNPTTPSEPTPAASSSAPPSGNEEWRAGPSSRFAGKSKEEILGIAEGLAIVAERFNQPMPQPVVEQPRSRFDFDIPDDEYVDGRRVKQILAQFANQPAPVDMVARQQNLALTVNALKAKYPDEFKRWLPEIQAEISNLPQQYWNLDTLSTCVDIVKSRHVDELAAEKAQRLISESHPTIRSGSGGSGSVPQTQQTMDGEAVPETWRRQAHTAGIDESKVDEFCQAAGITKDQYYADLAKYGKGGLIRG